MEVGPVLELIVAMTDQFCREKLNEEMPSSVAVWLKSWPATARPPCLVANRRPGRVGLSARLVGSTFLTTAVTSRT